MTVRHRKSFPQDVSISPSLHFVLKKPNQDEEKKTSNLKIFFFPPISNRRSDCMKDYKSTPNCVISSRIYFFCISDGLDSVSGFVALHVGGEFPHILTWSHAEHYSNSISRFHFSAD